MFFSFFQVTGGPLGLIVYAAKFSIGFGKEIISAHLPRFDLSSPYGDGAKLAFGGQQDFVETDLFSERNYEKNQNELLKKCKNPECRQKIYANLQNFYHWKDTEDKKSAAREN